MIGLETTLKKQKLIDCGILSRKNKAWVLEALDRSTKEDIAWAIGKHDSNTVKKLYDKLRYLKECIFYTDH